MNPTHPQPATETDASPSGYLRDLAERRIQTDIEQCAGFGALIGFTLAALGAVGWCAWPGSDRAWLSVGAVGIATMGVGAVCPQALAWPTRGWMKFARFQGWLIFSVLLTTLYLLVLTPLAYFHRWRQGTAPFFAWDAKTKPPAVPSAWEPIAALPASPSAVSQGRGAMRSPLAIFGEVLGFFIARGNLIVVPLLILLLLLGLILFFAQGSALAPMIYTLF